MEHRKKLQHLLYSHLVNKTPTNLFDFIAADAKRSLATVINLLEGIPELINVLLTNWLHFPKEHFWG